MTRLAAPWEGLQIFWQTLDCAGFAVDFKPKKWGDSRRIRQGKASPVEGQGPIAAERQSESTPKCRR
jgi:hypothetical protein